MIHMDAITVAKVLIPSAVAFFLGIAITPLVAHYLYTHRMGGIIIWVSTAITMSGFFLAAYFFPGEMTQKLNFLSRNQTWLPLFTLIIASLVGLVDDVLVVRNSGGY